jgi:hypothetical protein
MSNNLGLVRLSVWFFENTGMVRMGRGWLVGPLWPVALDNKMATDRRVGVSVPRSPISPPATTVRQESAQLTPKPQTA